MTKEQKSPEERQPKWNRPTGIRKKMEKHGLTHMHEYQIWTNMKQRCTNPKRAGYKYYGGRGIKVCDSWMKSFKNFLDDMGKRPDKGFSIDRIDPNGNYEPSNCRWVTNVIQATNKRKIRSKNGRFVTSDGIGVVFDKQSNKFRAQITIDTKNFTIGFFQTEYEATVAYNKFKELRDEIYILRDKIKVLSLNPERESRVVDDEELEKLAKDAYPYDTDAISRIEQRAFKAGYRASTNAIEWPTSKEIENKCWELDDCSGFNACEETVKWLKQRIGGK